MTLSKTNSKYFILLILGMLIVLGINFAFGNPSVELLLSQTNIDLPPFGLALRICIVLGLKAFLYFIVRQLQMSTILCWTDVILTLFLTISLMWNGIDGLVGKDVSGNTTAIMSLLVGTWTLIQLFVFVNFMILRFQAEKNEIMKNK